MSHSSLVIVGSGIKFMSHLTIEAQAHIKKADKVLYLVNEPVMQQWLQKNHRNAESLDPLYFSQQYRIDAYQQIAQYIFSHLGKHNYVCVVLYGHPTVFAQPALDAVMLAKKAGHYTEILPGISSEDCLFADLLIDPGLQGCLSLEATAILLQNKHIDISCHVIIWQISVIGALGHAYKHDNKKGLLLLTDYLKKFYEQTHQVILYSAAQYAGFKPSIKKIFLSELAGEKISATDTLYIPPMMKSKINEEMLAVLNINKNDLHTKNTEQ